MQKKGTEASKRLSLASYTNAQARKKLAKEAQEAARKANDAFRAKGERTPYQERKREKFLARIAEKHGSEPAANA